MPSAIKIILGETEYSVPKMNLGQIEDLTELAKDDPKWPFKALAVLLRRASPEIKDVREVEAEPGQMREAIDDIMKASGFNLPNREAPAPEPGQGAL